MQDLFTYNYKATLIVCKNERTRGSALRHAVATQGVDKALEINTGIYCICRLDLYRCVKVLRSRAVSCECLFADYQSKHRLSNTQRV